MSTELPEKGRGSLRVSTVSVSQPLIDVSGSRNFVFCLQTPRTNGSLQKGDGFYSNLGHLIFLLLLVPLTLRTLPSLLNQDDLPPNHFRNVELLVPRPSFDLVRVTVVGLLGRSIRRGGDRVVNVFWVMDCQDYGIPPSTGLSFPRGDWFPPDPFWLTYIEMLGTVLPSNRVLTVHLTTQTKILSIDH